MLRSHKAAEVGSIPTGSTRLCSSVVEQGFCKSQVASSNLVEGFYVFHIHSFEWGISSEAERQFPILDVIGSIPLFSTIGA